MCLSKSESVEVINFLKEHFNEYNKELIDVIDSSDNGIYFVNEESISFSDHAKKLLNVDNNITIDFFYNQINLQDRKKLFALLNMKQNELTPYEIIYRYKLKDDSMMWIKEHGIFSYKNKKQRIALITNYTKQVEQDKKLHKLAFYDSVTNIKNRNFFNQDIDFLIKYQVPFAYFLLDINSFKIINDNFGHSLGDYVLKQFSIRLKECLENEYDFDFYRISGDEFAILFPYINSIKETDKIIKTIFEAFLSPFYINDLNLTITPSIGITFFPKDSKKLSTLIKYADISMYRAKNDSYINYSYFDKTYYKGIMEEKAIEEHINKLIKNDSIILKYQPIYNLNTKEIIAYEALFNTDCTYNAEKIFNTALKSHLIVLLDRYILEKVISDINKYQCKFRDDIIFTINITPKTAVYIDLYKEIKSLLEKYQVKGNRIGIEITEQYFVNDETKLNELIDKIKSLGIKIYLDDFGMGYSSVRNLAYITYDHIKLDKRIISCIFKNQKCDFFLKSILQFSKDANCDIIVEGVETKEQLDYLHSIGVNYVQGYYFCKPVIINEAFDLI